MAAKKRAAWTAAIALQSKDPGTSPVGLANVRIPPPNGVSGIVSATLVPSSLPIGEAVAREEVARLPLVLGGA
mgnify:CR=1